MSHGWEGLRDRGVALSCEAKAFEASQSRCIHIEETDMKAGVLLSVSFPTLLTLGPQPMGWSC